MYQGAKNATNSATKAYYFENKEQFLAKKEELIREGDIVLVKASHGMHFEEIISQLQSAI
jgi:UDP-N-acetylmuramoyl-tripeptide--D-alanyl-D-alanine ligase